MSQSAITMEQTSKSNFRTPLDKPIAYLAGRFGGARAKELERFLRFAVVGLTGAVIDLGTLTILQASILPPVNAANEPNDLNVAIATTIAFVLAVISNFTWTRLWVYPESRSRTLRQQLGLFFFISVVGWLARTLWITLMYVEIGHITMPIALPIIHQFQPEYIASIEAEKKLGTLIAQMIAMIFVMLWNFFANRYWTYNDVE